MSMMQKILDISREPFRGEEPLYQLVLIAESCTQSERFGSIQMRLGDYVKTLASYASEWRRPLIGLPSGTVLADSIKLTLKVARG